MLLALVLRATSRFAENKTSLGSITISVCQTKRHSMFRVRVGSKADICSALDDVRFTPNSDRQSGFPQTVMSANIAKQKGRLRGGLSETVWLFCSGGKSSLSLPPPTEQT